MILRRNLLNALIKLGALLTAGGFFTAAGAYLQPLGGRNAPGRTLTDRENNPIPASSLSEGETRTGILGGSPALVLRREGRLIGLSAVCPHLGCVVRYNAAREQIECPCHGGRFTLRGEVLGGPPARPLQPIPLRIVEDRIVRGQSPDPSS